jgi:hypothetical protein
MGKKQTIEAGTPSPERIGSEWTEFVKLLHGMATDDLMGNGPTKVAFVQNLRIIANRMESLIPNTGNEASARKDETNG